MAKEETQDLVGKQAVQQRGADDGEEEDQLRAR